MATAWWIRPRCRPPGKLLEPHRGAAPNEAAAAQYYPAIYWYSMLEIPQASEFGGHSRIPKELTQADWLKQMKNIGCIGCHQLGQLSTRTILDQHQVGKRKRPGSAASSPGSPASR